jgi:hypothetical protein
MIAPQELRLGNLVMANGIVFPVRAINSDGTILYRHNGVTVDISKCEPIPLTKEWLIKFGFYKTEPIFKSYPSHPYWVKDGICLFFNESDDRDIYLAGYAEMRMGEYYAVGTRWIRYVHEVQNFYYSAKKSELTIK